MGCCCSTSRWVSPATTPCRSASGCCARKRPGHTGTLDPLATGVLPLCFGAATKFSQLQLDADKTYEATVRLGVKTSTGDAEGEVIAERPVPAITPQRLAEVASAVHRRDAPGAAHAQRA